MKEHQYIKNGINSFGISPLMQELMVYAGHLDCYGKCNELLEKFISITVNPSQIYRVTNFVSEQLEDILDPEQCILPPIEKTDVLYVEMDGSMVQTREEGWKEAKLGRIFKGSDCLNPNSESSYLANSHYVGHFGRHVDFCQKLEQAVDSYGYCKTNLVFITDGASWIKNWIEETYPYSYAILDYYHACEHLHEFAEQCFGKDIKSKEDWCNKQKELLLDYQVKIVMKNINKTNAGEKDKEKLLKYYDNNLTRMNYKLYKNMGCGIIGSGAIESAHRTVIQKRMKLSGQHWTRKGVHNMLRLRIVSMNKQWHKVIEILKPKNLLAA